jgi:hypothetical protein
MKIKNLNATGEHTITHVCDARIEATLADLLESVLWSKLDLPSEVYFALASYLINILHVYYNYMIS